MNMCQMIPSTSDVSTLYLVVGRRGLAHERRGEASSIQGQSLEDTGAKCQGVGAEGVTL
jgi:hypothetical protein